MTALLFLSLLQASGCAWMNDATAAGILGGEVKQSGCEFSREADRLSIEVFLHAASFRSYLSRCKSSVETTKAIGNEAVFCDGEGLEQIAIGRVRDQVFVLRLKAAFTKAVIREKLKVAAEIVSGNLY